MNEYFVHDDRPEKSPIRTAANKMKIATMRNPHIKPGRKVAD